MTIDEAIKILSNPVFNTYKTIDPRFPRALKLSLEALKHYQEIRHQLVFNGTPLLPGETEVLPKID